MSISKTERVAKRAQRKGVEVNGHLAQHCLSSKCAAFHYRQILSIKPLLPGGPKHPRAGQLHV